MKTQILLASAALVLTTTAAQAQLQSPAQMRADRDALVLEMSGERGWEVSCQVEQGDGGLVVVDAAKADLTSMPRFAYEAETSAEASLQGESGGQDSSDDDGLMPDMDGSGDTSTPQ